MSSTTPTKIQNPQLSKTTQQQQSNPKRIQFLRQQQRLQKQRVKKLYEQINIQKQKSQRLENQHRQKIQKMYQKIYAQGKGSAFLKQGQDKYDNDPTEVPVDGQVYLGSRVYMVNCASCHALQTTTNSADSGPSLGLIFNRRVATDINYINYSRAAIDKAFFWTSKNLFKFMFDPLKMIPGTRCGLVMKPIASESDRADLITFLREYSKELELNTRIELIKRQGYEMYQTKLYAQKVKNQRIQKDLNNSQK